MNGELAHGSASQKPDWPQINTDEHRLKRIGLSVFICVYLWPRMFFSGSSIGGSCPAGFFHGFSASGRAVAAWALWSGRCAEVAR
jgi:hypothetical protein